VNSPKFRKGDVVSIPYSSTNYSIEEIKDNKYIVQNLFNKQQFDVAYNIFDAQAALYSRGVESLVFKQEYLTKIEQPDTCKHPNKYANRISRAMVFMVCPDCKKDLGDV
jgi:NMD protein affecting ribosome stability and mRNA decay